MVTQEVMEQRKLQKLKKAGIKVLPAAVCYNRSGRTGMRAAAVVVAQQFGLHSLTRCVDKFGVWALFTVMLWIDIWLCEAVFIMIFVERMITNRFDCRCCGRQMHWRGWYLYCDWDFSGQEVWLSICFGLCEKFLFSEGPLTNRTCILYFGSHVMSNLRSTASVLKMAPWTYNPFLNYLATASCLQPQPSYYGGKRSEVTIPEHHPSLW